MTTNSRPAFNFAQTPIYGFWRDLFKGSHMLTRNALLLLLGFAACLAAPLVDPQMFNGIDAWHKPAKFFFSLGVQLATVAWALSLVDDTQKRSRAVRWSITAMITAAWLEIVYIVFRAARGEGSHYNTDTPLTQALYGVMGLGALTLTITAAIIGLVIWRKRNGDLWREAAGLGLVLGAILATVVGGVLSSNAGHWIGGDQSDATGLPLFYWSTTGGDLRIAHFTGLHAMQLVPFAALSGRRDVVYGMAVAITLVTIALFAQAMMGVPLFRA